MSNTRQVTMELTNKKRSKWDEAIADAKKKIAGLHVYSVYEIRKAAGDKWPSPLPDLRWTN